MLPKTHIILGFLFSIIIWIIFPDINLIYLALIFLSSFLIDFDHYTYAVMRTKSLSLTKNFNYYIMLGKKAKAEEERGIRNCGPFNIFHTLEFMLVVYLLAYLWAPFIYVFIGMAFHSILDIFYLINRNILYKREFFLARWLIKRINK